MNSTLVSLNKVAKSYKDLEVLTSINLSLAEGEVLGLFGHNGAGKTTMMKLILGVISPDAGSINVMGMAPDSKAAWHSRRKIGYLPENVSFYEQLTGLEVLTYFARLKGFNKKHAESLLEQVGITHAMKRQVKTYSKGMRQRLGLAQAFIGEPKLLLLDEPTVGLDPLATADFYRTVDQLKSNGSSIILCSHVLPGVERHIDKAMILSAGKQIAMGTLVQLRNAANLPVIIKPFGVNGTLKADSDLLRYLDDKDEQNAHILKVPEAEKLAVLKRLLAYNTISDLYVEHANLEQVYQYYLTQSKPQLYMGDQ